MIYIDKKSINSHFHKLFDKKGLSYEIVDSDKDFEDKKSNIFITASPNKFVHPCPATKIYRCCNYHVTDAVEGCPFDCTYCILQSYLNHNYIKVYSNLEGIETEIKQLNTQGKFRLGTGELSDSLALDNLLELSSYFIPIINDLDNIQFELKTKSSNISNLLNLNPKNIVISWSLNPEEIVNNEEHFASTLSERIKAAKICQEYGYKVSFHFDPLIYYHNFEKGYQQLIEDLFNNIDEQNVEFISMSTFRFIPELIDIIRDKFDQSYLLESEYVKSIDGKMRYFKSLRQYMLKTVIGYLRKNWSNVFIYFCMEHSSIWDEIFKYDPGEREEFEQNFPWYKNSIK
jgi:spore photoproduct lyase